MNRFLITLFILSQAFVLRGYAQEEPTSPETESTSEETPQKGIENIWRTSDLPHEQGTLRNRKRPKRIDGSALLPEGSQRVGCICMDYRIQKNLGTGACSGHNGVRFWLYQLPSGDTVKIPTLRHEAHPDTLSDAQIVELAAYKRYEKLMAQKQIDFFKALEEHPEWLDGLTPRNNYPPMPAYPMDSLGLFYPPFMNHSTDSVHLIMPPASADSSAVNTLIYSLSVLIGSGALHLINKFLNKNDEHTEEKDYEL